MSTLRNLIFFVRRALFSQPLGMTINILKAQFRPRSPSTTALAATPLPIDRLYGIETGGPIRASMLRTGSSSDLHSFGYGASVPSIIRRAIEVCPDLYDACFVDLGCGKGLPLVVASEYPFRRIVGVELSPSLCMTARENAARIARAFPDRTAIEIIQGDITTVELPAGYLIIFLYNPAYPPLLRKVARRLGKEATSGSKQMVIYYNPAGAQFFDEQCAFTRHFAAHLPLEPDELAASEQGNAADSVVVWQGLGEPTYPAHTGAHARVKLVAGNSAGEVQPVA